MRRIPRRKTKINIPVASMGDIAFLLIIFFMLCSNFAKEAGITVKPPRSPDIDKIKERRLAVAIDEEGKIYFEGQPVSGAKDIEYCVADALAGKTGPEEKKVMFTCDASVSKEVFEPVMDAISKGGGQPCAVGAKAEK